MSHRNTIKNIYTYSVQLLYQYNSVHPRAGSRMTLFNGNNYGNLNIFLIVSDIGESNYLPERKSKYFSSFSRPQISATEIKLVSYFSLEGTI